MKRRRNNSLSSLISLVAAAAGAALTYLLIVRPWHLRWGAADEEVAAAYPGDELVPRPRWVGTHAITIDAPLEKVWPWLAQMGQGRGGFYSYTWIENLMGADIQNSQRILPEFQNIKVGEQVPLASGGFGVPVALVEPGHLLVLHGDTRQGSSAIPITKPGEFWNVSWAFYLQPLPGGRTRLVERFRADWTPTWQNHLYMRLFLEPGSFIMERKMLLGIKQRAEALQ
jgi:hypothetical protein